MEGKKLIALHYIRKIHAEEIEFYKRREKKIRKTKQLRTDSPPEGAVRARVVYLYICISTYITRSRESLGNHLQLYGS